MDPVFLDKLDQMVNRVVSFQTMFDARKPKYLHEEDRAQKRRLNKKVKNPRSFQRQDLRVRSPRKKESTILSTDQSPLHINKNLSYLKLSVQDSNSSLKSIDKRS